MRRKWKLLLHKLGIVNFYGLTLKWIRHHYTVGGGGRELRGFFLWHKLSTAPITLPWQWSLIIEMRISFILCSRLTTAASCLYSVGKWDGTPSTHDGHLSFDVAFSCSTLTRCGVCLAFGAVTFKMFSIQSSPTLETSTWEVSYAYQSVWRWKWYSCQSSHVLQRLRLCKTSDTVFRRQMD